MSDPRDWTPDDWYTTTEHLDVAEMIDFAHAIEQVIGEADQGNWDNTVGPSQGHENAA